MFSMLARIIIVSTTALTIIACGGDGGSTASSSSDNGINYTGTYCHGDFNKLIIDSTGGNETYSLIISPLGPTPITLTGTRNGDTLSASGTFGIYTFDGAYTFSDSAAVITGQITISAGGDTFIWNEAGTKGDCASIDTNTEAIPQFIDTNFVDVINDITDISFFRSAAGHDYSDDFESCRSMKHYFSPPLAKRVNNTVSVYAPVDGTIVHLETEESNFTDDGVTNQKVIIQSDDHPGVRIVLFHIDLLNDSITVNTGVAAGQQIGYAHMISSPSPARHDFDIAVHVNTPTGIQYVSYFDTITDALFNTFDTWGGTGITRDDFIHTQAARDADPLTCSGETFTSSGTLPIWFYNVP